jgi:hypothetical protein
VKVQEACIKKDTIDTPFLYSEKWCIQSNIIPVFASGSLLHQPSDSSGNCARTGALKS